MYTFIRYLVFVLLIFTPLSHAQLHLPPLFGDAMVLQQKTDAAVWGKDKASTTITIDASWGASTTTQTDEKGNWRTTISTPKAGGPYTITIQGSTKRTLHNIMIGEVWFASGQSNMQMPMKGFNNQPIDKSLSTILHSQKNSIRMFTVKRNPSLHPVEQVAGQWQVAGPSTTGNFSATAYYFAQQLSQVLNVPVGIIVSSWGGSRIEAWMDNKTLHDTLGITPPTALPEPNNFTARVAEPKVQEIPSALYHGMLAPLIGYSIKGAIWYQGESNRNNYQEYAQLQANMVKHWREKWQIGKFPFYFAQIAPFNYWDINSALLREAQLDSAQAIENSGMAVLMDTGQCDAIHPSNKQIAGERLAYWALARDYAISGFEYSGPQYQSHSVEGKKIRLSFSAAPNGISSFGKTISGFEIAGEDGVFYPAHAEIVKFKSEINVFSQQVSQPKAVRYAFSNCPDVSIFSTAGLPLSSFRTHRTKLN